jgi:metallo-beta-lactamase family protein
MSISLSFFGASSTVTGSCYLLQSGGSRVLIDCGMFQGSKTLKKLNYDPFPFKAADLTAVLLTHAHIDHTGLVPKLIVADYAGPIFGTAATNDLLGCMLPDSAHIQESDIENLNRRNKRRGRESIEPIYTLQDAERALTLLQDVDFEAWRDVAPGIRARWWNAGHLLGSGSIEVEVARDKGGPLRILFSGDIGPDHKMLQHDPEAPEGFDIVICESTYGDRDRIEVTETVRKQTLTREINSAHQSGGALLIPSFAVERTQEIVADIVALMDSGAVPDASIFVDSPLASKATAIFRRHARELENGEALARALNSPRLHLIESVEDSKALARFDGFHIIISASGMCDAGRIRHHLKNWLPERTGTVMLAGYQAAGTLGRELLDGEKTVRIHGEEIAVRASIRSIESYSGHADGPELLTWLKARMPVREAIFLTHGEEDAIAALKQRITGAGLITTDRVFIPTIDDVFEIGLGKPERVHAGSGERIEKEIITKPDWDRELSRLIFDINAGIEGRADERSRQALIRKLRRALSEQNGRSIDEG